LWLADEPHFIRARSEVNKKTRDLSNADFLAFDFLEAATHCSRPEAAALYLPHRKFTTLADNRTTYD